MYPVPTPVNVRHVIREDESILGWALTNDSCLKEKGYLERQLTKHKEEGSMMVKALWSHAVKVWL